MRYSWQIILVTLVLSACASDPRRETGYDWPYPEKTPTASSPRNTAPPAEPPQTQGMGPVYDEAEPQPSPPTEVAIAPPVELPPLPDYPRSAEQVSGSAVASLIRQARDARAARQPQVAQGKLERALKIEPRNYFAWSALAGTYLDLKDYDQAISIAGKSNSLARGNIYVELDNYRIMQWAREALGETDRALQAQLRADEIELRLQRSDPLLQTP